MSNKNMFVLGVAALLAGGLGSGCNDRSGDEKASSSKQEAPRPSSSPLLSTIELVPGKLKVRVFSHSLSSAQGVVPCWTYVTDGLLAEGQDEVALSVKREPGELEGAYPKEPKRLFEAILRYAAEKKYVYEGDSTQLERSRPGIFRPDFHGIIYTRGQPLEGVSVPGAFLTAMVVTGPEHDMAANFGHVRLMGLLGNAYRFFPTAPWVDRARAEISSPEAMASSVLSKAHPRHQQGARGRLDTPPEREPKIDAPGSKVVFSLQRDAGAQLSKDIAHLREKPVLGLLLDLDPNADSMLVWKPGQTEPIANAKPGATGARVAGKFMIFVPDGETDSVKTLEDGFVVQLTDATREKMRAALAEHKPFELQGMREKVGFAISWLD